MSLSDITSLVVLGITVLGSVLTVMYQMATAKAQIKALQDDVAELKSENRSIRRHLDARGDKLPEAIKFRAKPDSDSLAS